MKLLIAAALAATIAMPAWAARCAPRQSIVDGLAEKYGETRKSVGLTDTGALLETFASDDTGTWTVIASAPNGVSCILAVGGGFALVSDQSGDPA